MRSMLWEFLSCFFGWTWTIKYLSRNYDGIRNKLRWLSSLCCFMGRKVSGECSEKSHSLWRIWRFRIIFPSHLLFYGFCGVEKSFAVLVVFHDDWVEGTKKILVQKMGENCFQLFSAFSAAFSTNCKHISSTAPCAIVVGIKKLQFRSCAGASQQVPSSVSRRRRRAEWK